MLDPMQSAQRQSCSQTGSDSGPPALRSIATAAGLSSLVRACVSCWASGWRSGPTPLSWRTAYAVSPPWILRVASTTGDACGWTLHAFPPGPGLIGAVVVQQVDRGSTFRVGGGFISGNGT